MIAVEGDMLPSEDHALAAFHPNTVETATPDNLQSDSLCLLRRQPRCYHALSVFRSRARTISRRDSKSGGRTEPARIGSNRSTAASPRSVMPSPCADDPDRACFSLSQPAGPRPPCSWPSLALRVATLAGSTVATSIVSTLTGSVATTSIAAALADTAATGFSRNPNPRFFAIADRCVA